MFENKELAEKLSTELLKHFKEQKVKSLKKQYS